MGWQSNGEDDSEGTSVGDRLGTLAQVVAAGAVLFSAVGFGWIETAIERLGSVSTMPIPSPSIGPGIGLTLFGISVVVLLVVAGLAIGAWYRLPDSPE